MIEILSRVAKFSTKAGQTLALQPIHDKKCCNVNMFVLYIF